jgi:hypothetical protein
MRLLLRTILTIASAFGLFIACGMGLDTRPTYNIDQRIGFFFLAALLALNLLHLFLTRPTAGGSRLWRLVTLWLDAKEKELRDRIGAKISN